ncbi:MAG: type II secretion system F family protein [Patescibacteria group bacterium]|nr:type II secretion system F family protein [Patescibacteria group bacterium]
MSRASRRKWPRRDMILFLERLEMYVSAGLGVDKALRLCAEGSKPAHRDRIIRAAESVEAGSTLSKAAASYMRLDQTIAGMIAHGESSGGLSKALLSGKALLERQDDMKKRIASAMAYPVMIGAFAGLLVLGLVRGIMPQIMPMLRSLNVPMPLLTRIVMAASQWIMSYWLAAIIGASAASACSILAYRKSRAARGAVHAAILRAPIIGSMVLSSSLAVFLRSCGSMIESGLGAARSFKAAAETVSLLPFRERLMASIGLVERGAPLGSNLSMPGSPPYLGPLVAAGESSGSLGASMIRAADMIERDLEHSLKRLASLMEPAMMAGMGGIVGAIALSIMMPIYEISKTLQH